MPSQNKKKKAAHLLQSIFAKLVFIYIKVQGNTSKNKGNLCIVVIEIVFIFILLVFKKSFTFSIYYFYAKIIKTETVKRYFKTFIIV